MKLVTRNMALDTVLDVYSTIGNCFYSKTDCHDGKTGIVCQLVIANVSNRLHDHDHDKGDHHVWGQQQRVSRLSLHVSSFCAFSCFLLLRDYYQHYW